MFCCFVDQKPDHLHVHNCCEQYAAERLAIYNYGLTTEFTYYLIHVAIHTGLWDGEVSFVSFSHRAGEDCCQLIPTEGQVEIIIFFSLSL